MTQESLDEICFVTCFNPNCDNKVKMTRRQKKQILVHHFTKNSRYYLDLPYCCLGCQKEHLKELGVSGKNPAQ